MARMSDAFSPPRKLKTDYIGYAVYSTSTVAQYSYFSAILETCRLSLGVMKLLYWTNAMFRSIAT